MITIEKVRCRHDNAIEDPEAPEMDCEKCAFEVMELGPCYGCVYLDNGSDHSRRWCALWAMDIKNRYRAGVEHCSAREQR